MKTLSITILLVLGIGYSILAVDGQEAPLTLQSAKELGRVKSRFLKEAHAETEASEVLPVVNLEDFQKSVAPLLNKSCLAKTAVSYVRFPQTVRGS